MFLPHVVITDPAIENLAHSKTFRSATLWEQVCHENTCEVLRVGSVVEFVAGGAEVQLGVVVAASAFQFHPLHSKMVVLTMNSELVRVHAQDATFVANEVFDARWVESLGVLHNRFNESFEARKRLVQLVHYFLACTRKYRATVDALMPQVYAHVASDDGASAVSLLKLVHTMSALHDTALPDYLHQCAFLMAVHTHLCGDCVRWLVPGCVPLDRTTNLAFLGCSNSVPAAAVYFATPVHVMAQIAEFLGCDSRRLARFDALVAKTTAMKLPYDDLAIQWTIWDGKDLLPILHAVKYAAVYPHPRLLRKHAQCACLGKHPTQRTLYDFLVRLGFYNNPQNPLTDPVLSSGVLGPLAPGALAASSFRDRVPTTVAASAARAVPTDHFVHLRTRKYFKDHVVYILPGKPAGMAVSVEKSNSRRYLINIHVADPATKISPSSATFVEWARTTTHLVDWPDDSVVEKPSLMPDLKHIYFVPNDTLRAAEYFRVGDLDGRNDERELPAQFQSCMTLTFEYNPTLSEPLRDLTNKVQVTFDDISRTRIKRLDARTLDAGLVGSTPGLLRTFRLFSRRPSSDSEPQLGADDQQNLSFLDAFCKVHFTLRNRNDAACALPPALGGILRKKHTLHALDGTIATHMELAAADRHARASFFVEEARVVAGALAAAYCSHHRVPAVFRDQQLINGANSGGGEGGKVEGVVIKHKNAFFPAFTARSYYDTAFARDPSGHLSTLAALFAYCHLGRERLVAGTAGHNTRHGLANGFVDVACAPESMEAYLNQLQVLAHVHQNAGSRGAGGADRLATKMTRFAHLKAFGYPVHGPMHLHTIRSHLPDLEAARLGALYWQHRVHKYWVLRTLETRRDSGITFTCTVTRVYRTDGSPHAWSNFDVRRSVDVAVSAYCAQLGMEVHVLVPASTALTAGSEIFASEIVHVDAISGRLLMK
ncbi:hypothetical protein METBISCDRAFT_24736 [Metschnikowia bicuspidata]|uniref:Uncharacterized protein n=1 Tax=Metschnikowia bicuspidata TaxID=27322 RepID=A0A4P9Z8M2_9ASCO|nr:hypothetical protein METBISCDRAFT_24736 [Metschnikowia bicuspidata]